MKILREIADVVGRDSPVERAFAMREAAISAAKTNDWAQAEAWFGEAGKAAVADAEPMEGNAYMVPIARTLVKRTVLSCATSPEVDPK